MPTKKQRRRRDKGRRHEYEYVYVDEEGREVEVAEAEAPASTARKDARGDGRRNGARSARAGARPSRTIQPPSWRRVGKRGLIFAPILFLFVTFLYRDLTPVQRVTQTLFLLAVFLPFSYVMDSVTYRLYQRRLNKQ